MNQIVILFLILFILYLTKIGPEHFVSGTEKLAGRYDQIYPLDNPKYITPQQKDFQIILNEHSALDPNMQFRRPEIATQKCKLGDHCFNTKEYSELTTNRFKSTHDVINSKVRFEPQQEPDTIYVRHQSNKVVPANSTSREMRADLFDDIVLTDLFFKQRVEIEKQPN